MKTLILYATKSNATKECAELLFKKLGDCTLADMKKNIPDIQPYDTILIGAGIRMGKVYKPLISFIQKQKELLLTKKIAFFFCNAYPDTFQKAIEKCIPDEFVQHALCVKSFGGKPPFTPAEMSTWLVSENVESFIQTIQ